MDPSCFVDRTQGSGDGVMMWGMFCWNAPGPLIVLEGPMFSEEYVNITADQVYPAKFILYPEGSCCFVGDIAVHRARIIHQWFSKQGCDFYHLSRPQQSADLNPIDAVWNMPERKILEQSPAPPNLSQFKDWLVNTWHTLCWNAVQNVVEFMVNRKY